VARLSVACSRRHRPKAPLNGVIIAVSVAELGANKPEFAIDLARKLRQRVQELTEKLEVFAPVYVVFTKADLIAGFVDFFEDRDTQLSATRSGAQPCHTTPPRVADVVAQFDQHFDQLYHGSERRLGGAHVACTAVSNCRLAC
jgi:type VI secretion system protein ImpL